MLELSDLILRTITDYAAWSGPIVGVLAFLESLVLIGIFVPAIPTMVAVGGFIALGVIEPAPVAFYAILGAILGDWASFTLGQSIGPAIYRNRWLQKHRLAFARARLFFRRYGFLSVLIGRFLGPIRSTVPVVAGVVNMPQGRFQAANILSALLWVPALLLPGYFTVGQLAQFDLEPEHFIMMAGALCVLPIILGWGLLRIVNKPRRRAQMPSSQH